MHAMKRARTPGHSERMVSDSAGCAGHSSAHAPVVKDSTTDKSITMEEYLNSFKVQRRGSPVREQSPMGHSDSASEDVAVDGAAAGDATENEATANAPAANLIRTGKAIPAKYGDEIKALVMEDPHIQAAVAVEHLRRKYCRHGIEPSDWPGDKRLNQKVRNTKRRRKKAGDL